MKIGDLLQERRNTLFVGRDRELELLQRSLSGTETSWRLIHFHGAGGMGKTTLLQQFAHRIGSGRCLYFDGHIGFQNPEDFQSKVPDTGLLNSWAEEKKGFFLLLDAFERWGAIEHWLREQWLPMLSPQVKVCTAGRYPLDGSWLRGDWSSLIQNVELRPFTATVVKQYANARGINDHDTVKQLHRFTGGIPLALSMACHIDLSDGKMDLFLPQQQLLGFLAMEMTKDAASPALRRYTEAASIVWRFDQERLQSILDEEVPPEAFHDFCRLPFVIRLEDGWSLHDTVRQWIYGDFQSRRPDTAMTYRKRALAALRELERKRPDRKMEWVFEKLFLHENDIIRGFCFQPENRLVERECTEQDLDRMEHLYLAYLQSQPHYVSGDTHLESLIRPIWRISPDSFRGIWRDGRLVAFCSCVPLTNRTVPIFRSNPITAPATEKFHPDQRQSLICLAGMEPDAEHEFSGTVARALARMIDRHSLLINVLCVRDWIPYLSLLGFERAQWADAVSPKGVVYEGYQLDLRHEDFVSKINRMLEGKETAVAQAPQGTQLPFDEAVRLIKRALKHYSRLHLQPEWTDALRPLAPEYGSKTPAEHFCSQVEQVLRRMSGGREEERLYAQILRHAYIQKIGTHETVAESLNLSVPTYYRHLRMAVRKLAFELAGTPFKTKTFPAPN